MEALRVMAEYSYAFRKRNFQDFFRPHFTRMLNGVVLKNASFSFKQIFAKYSGLMLFTLRKLDMLEEGEEAKIYKFFKQCLQSDDVDN